METRYKVLALFLQAGFLFSANPPTPSSWTFGATPSTDWTNTNNWSPTGVAPILQGSLAELVNGDGASPTITFGASASVGSVHFDLGTPYTLALSGAFGLVFDIASGSATLSVTDTNGAANHVIACTVALNSPLAVTQNSTQPLTITGSISGTQSLTMSGTGVLHLNSALGNSYTGGTTINSGTINVESITDNQLGTVGVTIQTGTLQFTNSAPLTSSRTYTLTGAAQINTSTVNSVTFNTLAPVGIMGVGSLEKTGPGTLVLGNVNTYQGGTIISAGQLNISNDNNLGASTGALQIGAATLLTTSGITTSRSGTFTGTVGSPSIIDTGGNTDVFTGNFGGPGTLTIQGGGTVQFTGTNSYTGGTNVTAASTLSGNTNGIQGAISLAAGTFLTFDQSFNGTYAGSLSGAAATLTKQGTGTVQFTGNSSFSGATNIQQGTLNVNGSLASSTVTVSAGAILSGSGTVGNTTNNGTIDPGNNAAVGTLNVGSLTLQAGSTVNISIAPLASDSIAATGAATLTGALTIEPTSGFYGFSVCYPIVTSPALTPAFTSVTSLNSAFVPTVTYSATTATLCVEITQPFAVFSFSNANTQAVGQNIDALNAAGQLPADLFTIFNSLAGQSFATINDALDQMHPAQYSAFTELQTEIAGQLISLFHRMPYLTFGCTYANRFWIEPFANSLTLKKHGMQIGSQSNSGGIAIGIDREVASNFILGVGGAWNRSRLEWYNHRGHGQADGFYGGLYADYLVGQFYIGGSILAGMDFYDTSRHIQFTTTDSHATAHYSALDIMSQLATAYLFGSPQAFFYPYANFDFLYLRTHQFQESGAGGLNLNVHQRSDSTFRTEMGLGLQVQDFNAAETMSISPKVSLGWVNMCPIDRPKYSSTFQGAPIPFSVEGWDESWNLLNVDFGLAITYLSFTIDFDYNVEISPDHETTLYNQHGNINLEWQW